MQIPGFSLAGRSALVTGAGRGIGVAIAHGLAQAGAEVILAARTAPEIEAVAADIRKAGGRASALVLDVTDETAVKTKIAALPTLDTCLYA